MAKTTLKPWRKECILVEVESTEPLTTEEKEKVAGGIRVAFSWCCLDEPAPSTSEIRQAIEGSNPALAKKIINTKFC